MRTLLVALWSVALAESTGAQGRVLVPAGGLVIERSARLRPGVYRLPAPATLDSAVIVIRGSNITVDLAGVHMVGAAEGATPDAAAGVALLIDGGSNITVKNARISGYKIAILARGVRDLRILDTDLSHNWKPRLFSGVEHESLADWLSFHQNEKDEWLRYGAAIYLSDVRGGEVRGNTARQGMNALLINRTDSLLVWNNDFSFNSGLGIGMYRSDFNRIMHNRVEYNVRGYSEGFYRRGQDSAGILIYEQSDSNTVAYNSVTHGGDGLFLWAGQHTMDTGQGGANDNVIFRNDFSWAPTNGMEATFSRNAFIENRVVGSDYGLWGGYSYSSIVAGNTFERNRIGIAIEHGQDNSVLHNRFAHDSTHIYVWGDRIEPSDWGYPKHRDTRSRDYTITSNVLSDGRVAYRIGDTHRATLMNLVRGADTLLVARGDTSAIRIGTLAQGELVSFVPTGRLSPSRLAGGDSVLPGSYADWPRNTIIVDEWGPYDWSAPKLWPADSASSTPLELRVLGPRNGDPWQLRDARGATISKADGVVGDTIVVTPLIGPVEDWTITLVVGAQTASYSRFDPLAVWEVKVFAWADSSSHPLTAPVAFTELLEGKRGGPAIALSTRRLDYVWYRPRVHGWPQERAGVVATTTVRLPAGRYAIRTISDDGIRVFVDDELVLENWSVHESKVNEVPLAAGPHRIRVHYFQRDGWTELRAEIIRLR